MQAEMAELGKGECGWSPEGAQTWLLGTLLQCNQGLKPHWYEQSVRLSQKERGSVLLLSPPLFSFSYFIMIFIKFVLLHFLIWILAFLGVSISHG